MAVSNTYGRVRKPICFTLIGLFSGILGSNGNKDESGGDGECSLWMPVPPPGYKALGCVVNIGKQPPSNHIVYCIRSDLTTSATYSECILSAPANVNFVSGFSIWRIDNVLASFLAHASTGCPPIDNTYNLNHLLLWNSIQHHSSKQYAAKVRVGRDDPGSLQKSNQVENSSGWDIIRLISKAASCYMSTPNFERIWWDKGGDLHRQISIWRPIARPGYAILGDCITEG